MEFIWSIIIIVPLLLYEIVFRPKVCKKKIHEYINNRGGYVDSIEKLTAREQLYCVYYTLDGKSEKAVVQFDFLYESTWR